MSDPIKRPPGVPPPMEEQDTRYKALWRDPLIDTPVPHTPAPVPPETNGRPAIQRPPGVPAPWSAHDERCKAYWWSPAFAREKDNAASQGPKQLFTETPMHPLGRYPPQDFSASPDTFMGPRTVADLKFDRIINSLIRESQAADRRIAEKKLRQELGKTKVQPETPTPEGKTAPPAPAPKRILLAKIPPPKKKGAEPDRPLRSQIGTQLIGYPVWHEYEDPFEQARSFLLQFQAFPIRFAHLLFRGWNPGIHPERVANYFGKKIYLSTHRTKLCSNNKKIRVISNPMFRRPTQKFDAQGFPRWHSAWDVMVAPIILLNLCRHEGVVLLGEDFKIWVKNELEQDVNKAWEYRELGVCIVPKWENTQNGFKKLVSIEFVQAFNITHKIPFWIQFADFLEEFKPIINKLIEIETNVSIRIIHTIWASTIDSHKKWPDSKKMNDKIINKFTFDNMLMMIKWRNLAPIKYTVLNASDINNISSWEYYDIVYIEK